MNFPAYCRAEAALTAYSTALDWVQRYPAQEVVRRLEEKVQEKRTVVQEYATQKGWRHAPQP